MIRSAWLVDATVYHRKIDKDVLELRKKFYALKNYAKHSKFGIHPVPTQNSFSIGLLRIGTILANNGICVRYIHADDVETILHDENASNLPDIVMFSSVTPTIEWCSKMSYRIRQMNSKVKLAIGGAHVNAAFGLTKKRTFCFDRIIKGYDIDAVETLFSTRLKRPKKYVNYNLLPRDLKYYGINLFTILGCVNRCNYCTDHKVPHYKNTDDGGLAEIIGLVGRSRHIHYFDSTLGGGVEGAEAVSKEIRKVNHSCYLSCDFRADLVSKHIVMELESAGFKEIMLGVETSDSNVLLFNNRCIDTYVILKALRTIRDYTNMYISIYTLTGLPGANENTTANDIEFFSYLYKDNLVDEIKNTLFVPYPNDNINWEEKGLVIENRKWCDYDRQSFPVFSGELSSGQIWENYLEITKSIVDDWESALQCSTKGGALYPEYILEYYSS